MFKFWMSDREKGLELKVKEQKETINALIKQLANIEMKKPVSPIHFSLDKLDLSQLPVWAQVENEKNCPNKGEINE